VCACREVVGGIIADTSPFEFQLAENVIFVDNLKNAKLWVENIALWENFRPKLKIEALIISCVGYLKLSVGKLENCNFLFSASKLF